MSTGVVVTNPASAAVVDGQTRPLMLDGSGALRTTPTPTSAVSAIATTDTSGAISAATNVTPLPANASRQLLIISNTGTNPMTLRFGAAATATVGHPISAGASVVLDAKCPTGSVNLFSTNGTTFTVTAG
jgi:hypothetical protein